jgi:glycine cleavage system H protein
MATNIPNDLRYSKEHEWASLQNNIVTIGITDFAQSSLGDIVFVELPKVGSQLNTGATFGVVESIKSVSDLYSPVSGKVIESNNSVESQPELINENPYSAWLIKVEVSNNSDYTQMLNATQYNDLCNQN